MKIETKYDYGQSVYFKCKGEICNGTIIGVNAYYGLISSNSYDIQTSIDSGEDNIPESDIYLNEEEANRS